MYGTHCKSEHPEVYTDEISGKNRFINVVSTRRLVGIVPPEIQGPRCDGFGTGCLRSVEPNGVRGLWV